MKFQDLGVTDALAGHLQNNGVKHPTPVQFNCYAPIVKGEDILVTAPTGSGKTLAFLLPLLKRIDADVHALQVLIVCPTRELVRQVNDVAKTYSTVACAALYGGTDTQRQFKKMASGAQLVVATPGRLLDHLKQTPTALDRLRALVLDEADEMLLLGFRNEMAALLDRVPSSTQKLFFSATADAKVKKLAYRYADALNVVAHTEDAQPKIDHQFVQCSDRWKKEALYETLKAQHPFLSIIFCRTIRRAEALYDDMRSMGYEVLCLHGDLSQNHRQRTLEAFKSLKYPYLVATDLTGRGIDIDGLTHIYNYDFPDTAEKYTHRTGRTGRMGKSGIAVSFVTPKDMPCYDVVSKEVDGVMTQYTRP